MRFELATIVSNTPNCTISVKNNLLNGNTEVIIYLCNRMNYIYSYLLRAGVKIFLAKAKGIDLEEKKCIIIIIVIIFK